MTKQLYPKIIFKLGPLAIITNYNHRLHFMILKYDTEPERDTFYRTMFLPTRIIGSIYWLHEFHFEVLK